jgi:transketolase
MAVSPRRRRVDSGWSDEVAGVAAGIRRRVLRFTLRHNGGYLSQACSSAEILATLYLRSMHLGKSTAPLDPPRFVGVPGTAGTRLPNGAGYNGAPSPDHDRFVFSPVHYALVLYSTLIEVGRLAPAVLDEHFNVDGSTVELIGAEHSPGHEVTAGSLGQALSQAAGIALARRLKGEAGRVLVFMSDGEFEEGQTWEAVAALAHHRIDNLVIVIDANGQQCDGKLAMVDSIEPLERRLVAFGASAQEVDGHDPLALDRAIARRKPGASTIVIARTDPCRGLDLLRARAPHLHYVRFTSSEERAAYQEALAQLEAAESRA